jgi:hypothetical protein
VSWPDTDILLNRIARYGLPVLVLIFYIQAARFLDFTPDSGYVAPTYAAGLLDGVGLEGPPWDRAATTPSPLWVLLLSAGGALGIDLVFTAKIFGLFFACIVVLVTYLLAAEMLADRLLALCIGLLTATAPWLMGAAVGGGGIALAMALSMGGLFFCLRGDLLPGVLLAALAGLILWPALLLAVLLVADDMRRAPTAGERRRRTTTAGLLLSSVLAAWALLAWKLGAGVVPLATGRLEALDPVTIISTTVLAGGGLVVIMGAAWRGRIIIGRSSRLPLVMIWCAAAVVTGVASGSDALLLVLPLLLMLGYLGIAVAAPPSAPDGRLRMGPVFAATAVLLLANQVGLYLYARPVMLAGAVETAQVEAAASWVRAAEPAGVTVASDRPWTVMYLTRGAVTPWAEDARPQPEVVVLSAGELPGYTRAYRAPLELGPGGTEIYGAVSVWTKSGE